MPRTIKTEYKAGYQSGQLHDYTSTLCNENLRKMELGLNANDRPLVKAYWEGYRDGLTRILIMNTK